MRSIANTDFDELRRSAEELDGLALVRAVLGSSVGRRIALVSSFGAESVVLLDMVASVDPETPVVFLDTGMLFLETLAYQRLLCAHLGLNDVRQARPDPAALARHDGKGDLHRHDADLCCQLRKTEPLEGVLSRFDGWITKRKRFSGWCEGGAAADRGRAHDRAGQDQSPGQLVARGYPPLPPAAPAALHPIVPKGFASLGCQPCTSPTAPGEEPRAGRWRGLDKLECGIHRN
jgi:phosphoadenosine phosphosulfate reductase